ncbi:16S rRNA (guanine(527)-N(7))-methyltransferase RsmG [Rubrivivax albus]|uniref:Ribosomal RNA small subunit methyltransferase G n=1 Tax=Rubrivivax albus TaxID=2499835 RepID=A0A437JYT4_9BURK|nr:16S rRNA (guanine(527)-N(7))-methyltransferase RsmG [Rubrivivax albus]RVT52790.1 16S rRNA (guanine(527)-N(7))-methyltransferase RsmG [Rubrivivax albus]
MPTPPPERSAAERQALLDRYLDLLARWNKVYNLTAVRDLAQMRTHHLADSESIVAPLERHAAGQPLKILDVGSGGGLPGVVLAIHHADWDVTCVDTVAKKAGFIRQVALELGLQNLRAEHARVEQLPSAQADVVTSRAFASLPDFCAWTHHHLAPTGVWLAMKGKQPADEIAALPSGVSVFHVEHLQVPGLDAERCAIWLRSDPPDKAVIASQST